MPAPLIALLLLQAPPVLNQSIVVTGAWQPIPLEESDRAVLSLPVRPNALLLNSIADVLRLHPSLDLRQRAPNLLQADLSIRGATFGQTLVLLNGRRMNDPQSGHHNLDLPAPLQSVQSVEILSGAGSTLYGADATGGVVNIVTSPPEASEIRLRAAAGNFGVNQQSVSVAAIRGRLSQQLAASRDFSSGFIPNRDYRNLSLASTTSLAARPGITTLDLGYADRPFGAQNFYGLYPSWERTKTWYSGLRQSLGEHTEAAFSFRRHTDLFYLFRDQPQRYQNHHAAESWQLSLRRRQPLRSNTALFYGAEGFGDSIQSSNLGRHSRARATAYTALDLRSLRRFSLTAGLRTESFRGVVDQISPSLSAALYAAPRLKLRAAASRAYRLPSFTELYYKDPANQGNSALLMESSWSHETGLDYSPSAAWRITTTLFHRRDRHGIDYTSAFATGPWTAANISALNFTGLESAASWQRRGHVVDFSYTALRGLSQLPPGVFTKYSFNYPIHSGVASWTGSLPGRLTARARLGALERRVRSPYALWDLYLARPHRRLSPFLQFTNLAGVRYQEIPGVAMPGRACLLGLELSLRP